MTRVLVTHASKYGSTAEIAEAIAYTLAGFDSLRVEIEPVISVNSITEFDAIVLGSALYIGQWQPSAVAFLHDHVDMLSRLPVWLFASGPAGVGDPNTLMKSWFLYPPTLRAIISRIQPRDLKLFHGKLDPAKLDPIELVIIKKVKALWGDFRRWDDIEAWAKEVGTALTPQAAKPVLAAPRKKKQPGNR